MAISATRQKPKCQPGNQSCGMACIEGKDKCHDQLNDTAKQLTTKLIAQIEGKTTATAKLSQSEIDGVVANAAFLAKATSADIIDRAFKFGKEDLGDQYVEPTPEILDAVWQGLSTDTRSKIKNKGKLSSGQYWDPTTETGYGGSNESRGKYIVEMFVKQNGRDAYTGLPIDLLGSDLEHIEPLSKKGASAENPSNFALVSRAVNQHKSDKNLNEWASSFAKDAEGIAKRAAKAPKVDKNALQEVLTLTDQKSWSDDKIDAFGEKFYYVSKALGLKNSYDYMTKGGGEGSRKTSGNPPAAVGKPIAKAMAKALAAGDSDTATKVREANLDILKSLGEYASKSIDKAKHQANLDKYKGLIY